MKHVPISFSFAIYLTHIHRIQRRSQTFPPLSTKVTWINDLRDTANGNELRTTHYLNVLECIHGPSFTGTTPMTVPHLHGGVIPMRHDGHPDFQFSPGVNDTYRFPNPQRAAMLWYHDHGLGLTRLNVYMGLAGAYILRDAFETNLRLPSGKYEMPLVIMDRDFNPDGSLKYQSSWASTFFGKYYLVNGKVRPGKSGQ
jgi:spore coat protein A